METTIVSYLDVPADDWNEIHEQIADIDDDYGTEDDVASAIQGGMNPDDYYIITELEGRYTVTKK